VEATVSPAVKNGTKGTKTGTNGEDDGAKLKDWGLKTAGTIIGGLGTAGAMVVIGSAILWIRFAEAGLPPIQAVSVQSRQEALVQGAEATIIGLLIAVGAVVLMYVFDRDWTAVRLVMKRGDTAREKREAKTKATAAEKDAKKPHALNSGALAVLGALVLGAIIYVWTLGVGGSGKLILTLLAIGLGVIVFWFGASPAKGFWAAAAAVFVSSIVFAGAAMYVVVKEQKYVQAVAILRDSDDRGVTGYYVAVADDKIYFANSIGIVAGSEDSETGKPELVGTGPDSKPMQEVPLTDSVTYSVGPLESAEDATLRAEAMLKRLIAIRDANPDEDKDKVVAPAKADPLSRVASRFLRVVVINRKITTRSARCLVRYGSSQGPIVGHWWTTCPNAQRLGPIENVREKLAIPNRGKALDMWVKASVPVDTPFVSLRGRAAPRCEHEGPKRKGCGHRYSGGGALYYVFDTSQIVVEAKRCTKEREDRPPKWGPCPKSPAN